MYQLKVQMETDSRIMDKLEKEKSQVFGSVADLKAMITSLEGQVSKELSRVPIYTQGRSLAGIS
jgi:hypothetical protein